jgi:hypothetical protein
MGKTIKINKIMIRNIQFIFVVLILFIFAALSMLNHWEFGGESWGYWYFARELSDGNGFIVVDRGPLYTIYLNAFRWIGYPESVSVEYIVTTTITLFAILLFIHKYIGIKAALFASLLWVFYLQVAEPPVQKLALACSLFSMYIRCNSTTRLKYSLSYTLLILSFYFRVTYIAMLFVFIIYDSAIYLTKHSIKDYFTNIIPRFTDLTLIVSVMLFFVFLGFQSDNPWNNVMFAPIGDFFGGAKSFLQILSLNSFYEIIQNFSDIFYFTTNLLIVPMPTNLAFLFIVPFAAIVYAAINSTNNNDIKIFVISSVILVCLPVLNVPNSRHMTPFIPVLLLASVYLKNKVIIYGNENNKDKISLHGIIMCLVILAVFSILLIIRLSMWPTGNRTLEYTLLYYSIILSILLFFVILKFLPNSINLSLNHRSFKNLWIYIILIILSHGIINYYKLSQHLYNDLIKRDIKILENDDYSMKASYYDLNSLFKNCNGVMGVEGLFFGAFMNIPINNLYGVSEIPTTGTLGNSTYQGLNINRINCLFISNNLYSSPNYTKIYENYIQLYAEKLINKGADVYEIPKYGKAVIYNSQ